MKTLKTVFTAIVIYSTFFISCNKAKNNEEQATKSKKDTIEIKTEIKTEKFLNDTIGVYKINNTEAREYIVKMSELMLEIDKVMDKNNPSKMPGLMKEIGDNQKKQLKIQSKLSESDRNLFKSYNEKISKKLIEQGDRMSNM